MTKSIKTTLCIATIALLGMTACSSKSTDANNEVKARQNAMQDWRIASDIMKGMVEKPDSFDAAAFKEQADFIANSSKDTWKHFANEANKGKSKDTVWTDAQGFADKAQAFDAAAAKLATVAGTATKADDVQPALGQLGESCGSCHKAYKQN